MEKYHSGWIIGSSGGIGGAAIEPLSNICDHIDLFDKVKSEIPKNLNIRSKFWECDISVDQEIKDVFANAVRSSQEPEILLIAAGQVISKEFYLTSNSEIASLFQNNYLLVFNTLKYFFKYCSKSIDIEKSVIVVSSNAGNNARPNQAVYASFKAAINSLVKSLAKDWGKYNIRINAVAPGTVIVPRNIDSLKIKFPNFPLDYNRPLIKLPYPIDLISTFLYLLSKTNPITGQIIAIDGGSTI